MRSQYIRPAQALSVVYRSSAKILFVRHGLNKIGF